ncbi:MAG: hypothetical protein FWD48_10375 [Oscillospiraceae bacterium]|nr:hypothetical protein [Oscillospiraceae bacterium]
MESILEELYYICIEEGLKIKREPADIITKNENKLCKMLKGKKKKIFHDYMDAYSEYTTLCAIEGFKHGFKAGCNVAEELFNL